MANYSNWAYLRRVEYFKKLYEKNLQKEKSLQTEKENFAGSDFFI
jgi:hypothetical protein